MQGMIRLQVSKLVTQLAASRAAYATFMALKFSICCIEQDIEWLNNLGEEPTSDAQINPGKPLYKHNTQACLSWHAHESCCRQATIQNVVTHANVTKLAPTQNFDQHLGHPLEIE